MNPYAPKNIVNPQARAAGLVRRGAPLGAVPGAVVPPTVPDRVIIPKRAPAAPYLQPFAPIALPAAGALPTRILAENKNRVAVILRSTVVGVTYFVGGPGSRLPAANLGVPCFGTEALTLETTDEVWAISTVGPATTICGSELVSNTEQP